MKKAIILGLAIMGALFGGGLGAKWISDASKYKEELKLVTELGIAPEAVAQVNSYTRAGYLLILAALVAVPTAGVNLKLTGREKLCGAILIGCSLVPALFAAKSLVFTFFLIIAGGMSLYSSAAGRTMDSPRVAAATY